MSRTSDLSGIAAMLAATAAFVVGDCFMKLVTEHLPPFEVLALRGVAASLGCLALVAVRGETSFILGALDRHALLRAAGETLSTLFYVVALARMPIADVIAILQTAPLILIVGLAFILREHVGSARMACVLVGFAGALLVAQPGAAGLSSAALFAFASAVLIAARDLVGRGVPARIPVSVVVLATLVLETMVAGMLSVGVEDRVQPSAQHLIFLFVAALFLILGHVGLLFAYRVGRTAVIAPFFYSFALWGLLAGLIVWGTLPNGLALIGIGLIAASGVAVVLADQRRGRTQAPLTEAL